MSILRLVISSLPAIGAILKSKEESLFQVDRGQYFLDFVSEP